MEPHEPILAGICRFRRMFRRPVPSHARDPSPPFRPPRAGPMLSLLHDPERQCPTRPHLGGSLHDPPTTVSRPPPHRTGPCAGGDPHHRPARCPLRGPGPPDGDPVRVRRTTSDPRALRGLVRGPGAARPLLLPGPGGLRGLRGRWRHPLHGRPDLLRLVRGRELVLRPPPRGSHRPPLVRARRPAYPRVGTLLGAPPLRATLLERLRPLLRLHRPLRRLVHLVLGPLLLPSLGRPCSGREPMGSEVSQLSSCVHLRGPDPGSTAVVGPASTSEQPRLRPSPRHLGR